MKPLLLLALFALPLVAQSAPKAKKPSIEGRAVYGTPQAQAGKSRMIAGPAQQVSMAQLRLREAVKSSDLQTIDRMFAEDSIFVIPSGIALNKRDLINRIAGGTNLYQDQGLSDMQVRMLAPAVGLVTVRVEGGGGAAMRIITVWQKLAGTWKAVAVQATPVR